MTKVEDRSGLDERYKWSTEAMFASDELWQTEFTTCQAEVETDPFAAFRGHLGAGADHLLAYFRESQALGQRIEILYIYAHTRNDEDTRVPLYQSMMAQIEALAAKFSERESFFEPEMLALPEATVAGYLQAPELQDYRHALEDLVRNRPHVLSAEAESLLAALSDALGGARRSFGQLTNADFEFGSFTVDGQEYPLSNGRFGLLMRHEDERVRQAAYEKLYDVYIGHKNAIASMYASSVTKDVALARARGFDTARAMRLFANNIPESVYDALIAGVHQGLPHLHRYVALRKRVLGLSGVRMIDKYLPLANEEQPSYTYEEAVDLVSEGLSVMGEEYGDILRRAQKERWIDVFENPGKRSGAYSTGTYGTRPYILLNYQGTWDSVSTLAHELGHSVHSYLARKEQLPHYSGYTIFLAEIASTVNETLLINHLLDRTQDGAARAALINQQLDSLTSTLFRQTMFAEFEWIAHRHVEQGGALTHTFLGEQYGELNRLYHGPDFLDDERASAEWSRIPHFYGAYYVYQYATGISAALVFADRIRRQGAAAVEPYLGFLRSGSSDYSLPILARAGLDMTDPAVVVQAISIYGELVTELEAYFDSKV